MTTAYGVTTGSCIATLLIVTAKVCSSVFCLLKSMRKFAGINWKRVTLTLLKIFYYRLAHRVGELSHPADGSYAIAERWNLGEEYWGLREK